MPNAMACGGAYLWNLRKLFCFAHLRDCCAPVPATIDTIQNHVLKSTHWDPYDGVAHEELLMRNNCSCLSNRYSVTVTE